MKYCKRFTEGLAYFACFLIIIFVASSYMKFDPVLDEETGEMLTFMSQKSVKEYVILLGMLLGATVVCSCTDRLPFIGLIVSFVPLYYILTLHADKLLTFCPMMIMIMVVILVAGEIVATVQWGRDKLAKK
ncbi:MAG: hypothetical protein IJY27_05900 [Clostridia bacterium]|nr:hypothetical protein [Clostridia bacterium]